MKFVTGGLDAAARATRHGDKRRDPVALDENDALSHELTPKLHRWQLILFVGRRENTPATAVQAMDAAETCGATQFKHVYMWAGNLC